MRNRRGGSRGPRLGSSPFENGDSESESPDNGGFNEAKSKASTDELVQTAQIEYLIHQSTLGVHFMFSKRDVARVMMVPTDEREFFTLKNMERVQKLLTNFLERPSLLAKERYLKTLGAMESDLLIRAYFHLVENTILSNNDLKH
ncbi:hypothetical protein BH10BDE1_BH10BDE1_23960 [soil metagenome]